MKYIGAHVSAAGGVYNAPLRAKRIGAGAAAIFTRNQRRWDSPPYDSATPGRFQTTLDQARISSDKVMPHAGYLINIGSADTTTRRKSVEALADELSRVEQLGLEMLNFHPGSSKGEISTAACIDLIVEGMEEVFGRTRRARLVLELTAGQGSSVGSRFEELAAIIEGLDPASRERTGVCIDTCHALAAGYDVATREGWERTMADFESTIGLERLSGFHLNDSKFPQGSRKDRHESIGLGFIGRQAFGFMMQDPRLDDMPLVLETPRPAIWSMEIAQLRAAACSPRSTALSREAAALPGVEPPDDGPGRNRSTGRPRRPLPRRSSQLSRRSWSST
jgi:deoxyribonuclease-4